MTLIRNIKTNSCGFDDISAKPIKAVSDLLAGVLCHITNLVLSTGIFPEKMKIAKVCVLYKGGSVDCFSNYRPISILPLFSKIVEKVINVRLANHLNKHALISPHQYVFQKGKSTESALLNVKDKIATNLENRLYTLGIFLDFSKAIDSLKHDILFAKLPHYGIRGISLDLLQSFLTGRSQCFY